jgi:hypothetical protein
VVKLQDSKGTSGEGFTRIFGNQQLGLLLSKVQASIIRSGFELEEDIRGAIPDGMLTTLELLNNPESSPDIPFVQVVFKPFRPDPENLSKSIQADFLIVDHRLRRFLLVEVKEGYVFDTKKADGELASLKSITSWLAQEFAFRTHYYLCSFNQENKDAIVNGTKKRFSIDHVMTGRELCEMVGINYDEFREQRKKDQVENLRYFLTELTAIPEVRQTLHEILSNDAVQRDG